MKTAQAKCTYLTTLLIAALGLLGCPPEILNDTIRDWEAQADYDEGFWDGFMDDAIYWKGFFDSYDTYEGGPIFYDATPYPQVESPPYSAGLYDGQWYAYNDGYYVNYYYAFIIGFSEGYDNAFWSDYAEFLVQDQHVEWSDGGWSDGYDDGYTEGRVFGAWDYQDFRPNDWLDALLDYQSGTDLYIELANVGTGDLSPATFYQHGTDPLMKKASAPFRKLAKTMSRSLRSSGQKAVNINNLELFRPLTLEAEDTLLVIPDVSLRSDRPLRLSSTWLERVEAALLFHKGYRD